MAIWFRVFGFDLDYLYLINKIFLFEKMKFSYFYLMKCIWPQTAGLSASKYEQISILFRGVAIFSPSLVLRWGAFGGVVITVKSLI